MWMRRNHSSQKITALRQGGANEDMAADSSLQLSLLATSPTDQWNFPKHATPVFLVVAALHTCPWILPFWSLFDCQTWKASGIFLQTPTNYLPQMPQPIVVGKFLWSSKSFKLLSSSFLQYVLYICELWFLL